ncbi:N-acetyl-S-(2-succino)cysteine monooxygenase [Hyphomicrobiales bacterium]|nr:N-acetyl-S-(2-succino)cysteine monooxygenase [Hyphomicrobiales bacterium]CAH1689293.1 N-acetyl-S-(2-succino)cysteine monooxygenase [Hyphomicrobiales bacterium]
MSQMHLGVFVLGTGHHVSAWKLPDAWGNAEDLSLLQHVASTAERGKFDLIFFADALNTGPTVHPSMMVRLEPLTLLSALAMTTSHIGLAATASATYSEPYNLARLFASLDHISGGRAAWNVVTGAFPEAALNFSRDHHPPHAQRYASATEFVKVAKGLWDSWEDGAIVMDKRAGQFADTSRMHVLDHKGEFYTVKGPLNISRPPQGHPVIIQAGASDAGRTLAASIAEIVFAVQQDLTAAKAFRADLRELASKAGRDPDHMKVMPGVSPIIGETEADAKAKLAMLGEMMDPKSALKVLSERLGQDLSDYPLDGPVPELPPSSMMQGHAVTLTAMAKAKNMTLRELRNYAAAAMGHRLLVGTPEMVADGLEEWFAAGAADGFNIMPSWFPGAFDDFVDHVVPILQKRGLFRTEYTGRTLRDHLGLPRPAATTPAIG